MDEVFDRVLKAVADVPSNLVLSVLAQVLYQSIPGEQLSEEQSIARMAAMLGLMNIMRDGYSERPRDQVSLAGATSDLIAIARCGSRPIIAPAMAFALVSVVANGRRDNFAESAALTAIGAVLSDFEAALGPEASANG